MNLQPIMNDSKLSMSKHFVNGFQGIINKVYFCPIQPNGFGGVSDGLGKSYENFMFAQHLGGRGKKTQVSGIDLGYTGSVLKRIEK